MKNKIKNKKPPHHKSPFPTREEILRFIQDNPKAVGKREIARAFGLKDDDRIALKKILRELKDAGALDKQQGRKFTPEGGLPDILPIEITAVIDNGIYKAKPVEAVTGKTPEITLKVSRHLEKNLRLEALGKGDRLLVSLERDNRNHYYAKPIRKLSKPPAKIVGVAEKTGKGFRLLPTSRKSRDEYILLPSPNIPFEDGDVLVAKAKRSSRLGLKEAEAIENLGPFTAPKAVSLMAITRHDIPWPFPEIVTKEAEAFDLPTLGKREDIRNIPLVTIDGADARDFDDAVFAQADSNPNNKGGWKLLVAIADVSHYVKSASPLDREAYKRGNSVYFPDRVVPMLPEALSNNLCSLMPKVERACLAVEMIINKDGHLISQRFLRGLMKSVARLTYEQVQEGKNGNPDATTKPLMPQVIEPLYAAYEILLKARKARGTLELDVQENKIIIGQDGKVKSIDPRARLESHRLIEEFMVLANVAAATALEERGMAGLYRVHDRPGPEKLASLRSFLKDFDINLPQGSHLHSRDLAHVLEKFIGNDHAPVINEVMLRSQAQAIYSPDNIGHFGLALARYAHFTSPIRRYADLIIHRALIRLFKLGDDGITEEESAKLDEIGEHISFTERRAIDAEREANDRYTALYLASHVGEEFEGRISGVTRAGLFIRLNATGADGLLPISTLPNDFYDHDESQHRLVGKRTGREFRLADKITIKLIEADPVMGSCRFALAGEAGTRTSRDDSKGPSKGLKRRGHTSTKPDKHMRFKKKGKRR